MSILKFFKRLFGLETSVDKITKPISSIIAKLDAYEAEQVANADKARAEAARRLNAANVAETAALNASATREKFASIFAE